VSGLYRRIWRWSIASGVTGRLGGLVTQRGGMAPQFHGRCGRGRRRDIRRTSLRYALRGPLDAEALAQRTTYQVQPRGQRVPLGVGEAVVPVVGYPAGHHEAAGCRLPISGGSLRLAARGRPVTRRLAGIVPGFTWQSRRAATIGTATVLHRCQRVTPFRAAPPQGQSCRKYAHSLHRSYTPRPTVAPGAGTSASGPGPFPVSPRSGPVSPFFRA